MSELVIEYCVSCNYYPRAAALAAELKKRFGIEARLDRSHGGVFEVTFSTNQGGELLFSKKKLGRFPQPGEVEAALEPLLGRP
ncbi:MAG TPA: Rdx family protein [Thermoanaerobaculia bacterium]|nr:Rdx family protein [Thermoanaerobaculia bacterium]